MRHLAALVLVACTHPATPKDVVTNKPTGSPVTTPEKPASDALLAWPVPRFTPGQIAEVKACDVDKLSEQRYPKAVGIGAVPTAFAVKTTCDRAVLAAACGTRLEGAPIPPACLDALRETVKANPAFAFAGDIPGGFFGKVAFAGAPPIAAHRVVGAVIDYKWTGLGDSVAWTLTVSDATGAKPSVSVTGATAKKTDGVAAKVA